VIYLGIPPESPTGQLRHPVGLDVETEHPSVAVGKILDQEFWHPVLVLIGHGGKLERLVSGSSNIRQKEHESVIEADRTLLERGCRPHMDIEPAKQSQ
jgi:hypothetical protein